MSTLDKYEYKVRADEIKALIAEGEFAEQGVDNQSSCRMLLISQQQYILTLLIPSVDPC